MVSQEWLPQQPQAGSAGACVLGYAGTQGVGAVAADEPPVLVGDHRTEVNARHARVLDFTERGNAGKLFDLSSGVLNSLVIRSTTAIAAVLFECRGIPEEVGVTESTVL